MIVAELITLLQTMPQDMEVHSIERNWGATWGPISAKLVTLSDGKVWIEGEEKMPEVVT